MFSNFSLQKVEHWIHQAGSGVLQTGTGYISGHAINSVYQWLHPGKVILGQPLVLVINPWVAGACAGIFAIVDLVAKKVIENTELNKLSQKPLYQLIRLAVSVTVSSLIACLIFGITFKIAAVAILSSLVASTVLLYVAKGFSELIYQDTPYVAEKC